MRQSVFLVIVLSVLSCPARPLFAARTSEVRSLVGVQTVRIVVEDLNQAMQQTGLRKDHLQALATEQLRQSGLTVLPPRERGAVPVVYIRLSSVIGGAADNAPVSFYLVIQVKQFATLVQGGRFVSELMKGPVAIPFLVTTWERGTMVMLDRTELFFYVRQILMTLIGELVYDHEQANRVQSQEH